MVIKKVEDKPMVIHRKDDKKIDHHIKKKKDIKEKLSKDHSIDTDKNRLRALKNSYMQQGQSVKTKNKSLFLSKDSMATEIGKAGLERMSDEIDGGSEIKDAAYTASYITSPAKEATMYAIQSTATQGAELARRQFRKRIIEKQKQKLKKVNVKDKILAKSSRSTAEGAAKYGAKTVAKGAAKTAAKESSKETAKFLTTETAKATAEAAVTVGGEVAAATAGTAAGPEGTLIGFAAGKLAGYDVGAKIERADSKRTIRMRKIRWFIDKTRAEDEQKDSIVKMLRDIAIRKLIEKIKLALPAIGLLFTAMLSSIMLVLAPVILIIAIIYNSPLAIFFPSPDTEHDDIRTVLSSYYMDFNKEIIAKENNGETITYQNTNNGAPISNYNDTLAVYMVLYGDGEAGYVMDKEGKKNLKKIFDEMNYVDEETTTTEKQVGDSIGKVWVTAYCPCSICCGPYANGITASGVKATPKHTIAVDAYNPIVPMGTKVVIEGVEYTVEDTGDLNHYGNDFDIFYATHDACGQWGRQNVEAYLADGNTNKVKVTTSGTTVHNLTYKDYIDKGTLNDDQVEMLTDMMDGDTWKAYYSTEAGEAVAKLALSKVGCKYDQGKRMEEGYYDCSSLVYRLYLEVGITLPTVADTQGQYCFENAMLINQEDLMPGDLIFYSDEENGCFRNITHVAIYVGDGKMVHAAGKARGVVLDDLRTSNIVFFARPYK